MEGKKLVKVMLIALVVSFIGYILTGNNLSWLLGILIAYIEYKWRK